MKLKEALHLGRHEIISLVGGGGKTSLMFALARELMSTGARVISTTTTKIQDSEPELYGSPALIIEKNETNLVKSIMVKLSEYGHLTIASERLPNVGKLRGFRPQMIDKLAKLSQISYVIVEADGAAHRPLKAPNATEPVIPRSTTVVIAVVGIDSLGSKLNEETVFRSEIVARLTGLALDDIITEAAIATLVTHPDGITKGSPATARIIPFINKTDLDGSLPKARVLALSILAKKHPRINSVILGQAQATEPALETISTPSELEPAPDAA